MLAIHSLLPNCHSQQKAGPCAENPSGSCLIQYRVRSHHLVDLAELRVLLQALETRGGSKQRSGHITA